jgi:hypothetical protein
MACLRLRTVRPEPLTSVPFFLRRIAEATVFPAVFPYFAIGTPFSGARGRVGRPLSMFDASDGAAPVGRAVAHLIPQKRECG